MSDKEKKGKKSANIGAEDDLFAGGSISGKNKSGKEKNKIKKVHAKKQKTPQQIAKNKALKSKILSKRNIRITQIVIIVIVVVALLFTYVATGLVRKGFVNAQLQWTTYLTGITVSDEEGNKMRVPVSTYNYYYAMTYNNLQSTQSQYETYGLDLETYGLDVDFDTALSKQTTTNDDGQEVTWAQYLKEEVIESIKTTYAYYMEAVKANDGVEPELTDDQKDELNDTLSEYKETANGYGYTLSGYLVQAMGEGVTEKVFRREATRAYIAENYEDEYSDSVSDTEYTDEEIETYKDDNIDDFKRITAMIFEADTKKDAKKFLKALNDDGSNFGELAQQYASSDFYKSYYEDENSYTYYDMTRDNLKTYGFAIASADKNKDDSYSGLDWLFSDKRTAGDTKQYDTTVVYIVSPAAFMDINAVNVRHILITPETDDDVDVVDATDEQWAAALETANSVLDEFNNSDKSAESFASLAEEYSEDTGSNSDGGLYEDIIPGQMVAPFNNWCFAERTAGDTAIVQTEYGYHIMYFDSESDTKVWYSEAQTAMEDEASTAVEDSYTANVNWFGSRYFEIDTDIDF